MEQSGIYKIVLFENLGINYIFKQDGTEIYSITTTGESITLTQCENKIFNLVSKPIKKGSNRKLTYDYEITFDIFDLTDASFTQLEVLNSINGWIPILYFRKGEIRILRSPLFFQQTELDVNKTHYYEIALKAQEPSELRPIIYSPSTQNIAWLADADRSKIIEFNYVDKLVISDFDTSDILAASSIEGITITDVGKLWSNLYSMQAYLYESDQDGSNPVQIDITATDNAPWNIDVDVDENIWVAGYQNSKIYKFSQAGVKLSEFATTVFDATYTKPIGLGVAINGTLWLTCNDGGGTYKIFNVETDGTLISGFLPVGFEPTETRPISISMAYDGTLWIVGNQNRKFYNITTAGVLISSYLYRPVIDVSAGIDAIKIVR